MYLCAPYRNQMLRLKYRHIIAWAFLLAFLLPSAIKMEHHHDRVAGRAESADRSAEFHEKCAVCDFEFSLFSVASSYIPQSVALILDGYVAKCIACIYVNPLEYSFSLRAPPM